MTAFRTFIALSIAALATACASPGATAAPASPGMGDAGTSMPMAAMDPRMKTMKDMYQSCMSLGTTSERT